MSVSIREGARSILLHHYLRGRLYSIEHYDERIELGLFTRDEMTWATSSRASRRSMTPKGRRGVGCISVSTPLKSARS